MLEVPVEIIGILGLGKVKVRFTPGLGLRISVQPHSLAMMNE